MNWCNKGIYNPWTKVNLRNVFADGDYRHLVNVGKKSIEKVPFGSQSYVDMINDLYPGSILNFNSLPEPYSGNPDANVYCLNMNPGEPDSLFDKGPLISNCYTIESLNNLTHNVKDSFWTEGMVSDTLGNIKTDKDLFEKLLNSKHAVPGFSIHAGARWQRMRTKDLWQPILKRRPNIFFLEYFPYHSNHGFDFPDNLPSYNYRNALLEFAMDEEKLIIIMRSEKKWYDIKDFGKRLKEYKKKISTNT